MYIPLKPIKTFKTCVQPLKNLCIYLLKPLKPMYIPLKPIKTFKNLYTTFKTYVYTFETY